METNNIYLGDAYELIKEIPDNSIDLIVTDPPYQIDGLEAKTRHMTGMFKHRDKTHVHEMAETKLGDGIDLKILEEFVRVMKKINIYIWCNKVQINDYINYFVKEKKCAFEILIWAKENPIPFCGTHYLVDKEYCLYFWEQGAHVDIPYERAKTFWVSKTNTQDKKDFGHPTIKDLEIIKTFVLNSSIENDVILDPFMGSGTTALAAKHLNRQYIGFEINETYYKIACDRLQGINRKGEVNLFDVDYDV